jgi:integrase
VPKLLKLLTLKGTIVTADALNCQRAIAQQIVDQEGDYALALKGNQGTYRVKDVRSIAVEEWLRSLKLSNSSKAKMRNIMHAVFNHAIRWEWHERNPISHVRQSAKRSKIPIVLSVEEIVALIRLLREPARTAVLLDVLTGLRVGELLALKWNDIDFQKSQISVTRSIVMQRIGDCKTEASRIAGADGSPSGICSLQLADDESVSKAR